MLRADIADLIIEEDIKRAMRKVVADIKAGKVWYLDLPGRGAIPEDIMSMTHVIANFLVAVNRRGTAARYN